MIKAAFQIKKLQKRFSGFQLGPLDLTMERGEVLGFIGPNGAGKTTTMRCMMDILRAESGQVWIGDSQVIPGSFQWKGSVGYVEEQCGFYQDFSAEENIRMLEVFYPDYDVPYALGLAERLDLPLRKKAKELSTGNRKKLALIQALAHRPMLYILDEPTSSLDPLAKAELYDVFREQMDTGETSIFFSTHVVADLPTFADRLAFIKDGQLLSVKNCAELMEKWKRVHISSAELPVALPGIVRHVSSGNDHELVTRDVDRILAALSEKGINVHSTYRMGLDEIALELLKEDQNV